MNTIWKGIMHLNAKAFCLTMILVCIGVTLYCGFKIKTPPEPIKYATEKTPELSEAWEITILDFVSNQLSSSSLIIPVDPFRPTIEAIFTNAAERAAFIAALKKAKEDATGVAKTKDGKKKDPFAHLRKKAKVPGQKLGPDGRPMITPILTYMGFIKRPDGTQAAMFYDSANKTTIFYDEGNAVHGVDIVNADLKKATLRMDDGSTRNLKIGQKVSLAPEESKAAPKKVAPKKPIAKNKQANKGKLTPAQKKALNVKRKADAAAKRKAQQIKKAKQKKKNFANR
ncbi:MAG: hypothetical protein PF904_01890 [Kiritimatiellae bacterium]|jgi:hypothetical protein|nr:hypothetical protein [Kiritimatiellia bacterium]